MPTEATSEAGETTAERYIVAIDYDKSGKRYANRYPLNVPLDLARGRYEDLSARALTEAVNDLMHELNRREEKKQAAEAIAEATGGWNPFDAYK